MDGTGHAGTPAGRGRRPVCGPDGVPLASEDAGQARRSGVRSAAPDIEMLETLIVQQWTKTLQGPFDWGEWPLARYRLGDGVVRAAADRGAFARCSSTGGAERLAWVCAMVACGRAERIGSLDPSPLCNQLDGVQIVRADGARGWRCNIERDAPRGSKLHYWVYPSGLIEFNAVLAHDEGLRVASTATSHT